MAHDRPQVEIKEGRAASLEQRITARLGLYPNFFRLATSTAVAELLWDQAQRQYLDNPLPSLFKERLFAYLCRFLSRPYCLYRHVGFLIGYGRPAGDASCEPLGVDAALALLDRPRPTVDALDAACAKLEQLEAPARTLPAPESVVDRAIFDCAVGLFLRRGAEARCREALVSALGAERAEWVVVLLSFVETVRFHSAIRPDLELDPDIPQMLAAHPELAAWLENYHEIVVEEADADATQWFVLAEEVRDHVGALEQTNAELEREVERRRRAEAKLAEQREQLARLNASLEAQVEQRTRDYSDAAEQAHRLAEALSAAEQRERTRLSHVLHDDLQQILCGLEMRFHVFAEELGAESTAHAQQSIDSVRQVTREAMRVTRALAVELDPPVLRGEGVEAALGWLGSHMKERHGLAVDVDVEGVAVALGQERRVLVVQIVRELLENVARHARTDAARVTVTSDTDELSVVVVDGGVGFEAGEAAGGEVAGGEAASSGRGIETIRERVRLLGGAFTLESEPGQGTRVCVRLPAAASVVHRTASASST